MDDAIGVEVGEGQGYVMAEIHLSVAERHFANPLKLANLIFVYFWSFY